MNNAPYNENYNNNLWWVLYYNSQNPPFDLIPQESLTPADHHVNQFAPPAISSIPISNFPQPFPYSAIASSQVLPHSNLSHISTVQNIQSPRSQQNTTSSNHSSSKQSERTSKNQQSKPTITKQSKPTITKRTATQNTTSTPKTTSTSKSGEVISKSKKRPREQEKDQEKQTQYQAIVAEVKELNKLIEPLDFVKDKDRSDSQDIATTLKNCREIFSVFLDEMNKLNQQKNKKIQDLESELQEEKVKRRAIAKYMINHQESCSLEGLKQSSDQQKDKKIQDLENELQEEKVKRRAIAKYMLDHKSICLLEELQNLTPQQNQGNSSFLDQQSSMIINPLDNFIQDILNQSALDELTSGALDLSKP